MTALGNSCPKCLSGMVSLRDERQVFAHIIEADGPAKALLPIAIDRTYTCNKCGYMVTHRESPGCATGTGA
jgi:hypothetical protein